MLLRFSILPCISYCVVYFVYRLLDLLSQVMASSSQGSQSRKKARPVGPIEIDDDGLPYGPHYDALAERISTHVCHCDEFDPTLTWSDHKKSGRVQALYEDLAVSIIMFYYISCQFIYCLLFISLTIVFVICSVILLSPLG